MRSPNVGLASLAIAALVAACGSSTPSAPKTKTISAQRVNALDNKVEKCGQSTTPACQAAAKADSGPMVIKCGSGLTTDSSCVFANNVLHAYQAAQKTYGKAPTGLTVTTNPIACSGSIAAWRCRSRRNTAVWVSFTRP